MKRTHSALMKKKSQKLIRQRFSVFRIINKIKHTNDKFLCKTSNTKGVGMLVWSTGVHYGMMSVNKMTTYTERKADGNSYVKQKTILVGKILKLSMKLKINQGLKKRIDKLEVNTIMLWQLACHYGEHKAQFVQEMTSECSPMKIELRLFGFEGSASASTRISFTYRFVKDLALPHNYLKMETIRLANQLRLRSSSSLESIQKLADHLDVIQEKIESLRVHLKQYAEEGAQSNLIFAKDDPTKLISHNENLILMTDEYVQFGTLDQDNTTDPMDIIEWELNIAELEMINLLLQIKQGVNWNQQNDNRCNLNVDEVHNQETLPLLHSETCIPYTLYLRKRKRIQQRNPIAKIRNIPMLSNADVPCRTLEKTCQKTLSSIDRTVHLLPSESASYSHSVHSLYSKQAFYKNAITFSTHKKIYSFSLEWFRSINLRDGMCLENVIITCTKINSTLSVKKSVHYAFCYRALFNRTNNLVIKSKPLYCLTNSNDQMSENKSLSCHPLRHSFTYSVTQFMNRFLQGAAQETLSNLLCKYRKPGVTFKNMYYNIISVKYAHFTMITREEVVNISQSTGCFAMSNQLNDLSLDQSARHINTEPIGSKNPRTKLKSKAFTILHKRVGLTGNNLTKEFPIIKNHKIHTSQSKSKEGNNINTINKGSSNLRDYSEQPELKSVGTSTLLINVTDNKVIANISQDICNLQQCVNKLSQDTESIHYDFHKLSENCILNSKQNDGDVKKIYESIYSIQSTFTIGLKSIISKMDYMTQQEKKTKTKLRRKININRTFIKTTDNNLNCFKYSMEPRFQIIEEEQKNMKRKMAIVNSKLKTSKKDNTLVCLKTDRDKKETNKILNTLKSDNLNMKKAIKNNNISMNKMINKNETKIENIEKHVQETDANASKEQVAMKTRIDGLTRTINSLQLYFLDSASNMQNNFKSITNRLDNLEKTTNKSQMDIKHDRAQILTLESKIDNNEEELVSTVSEMKILKKSLASNIQCLEYLVNEISSLKKNIDIELRTQSELNKNVEADIENLSEIISTKSSINRTIETDDLINLADNIKQNTIVRTSSCQNLENLSSKMDANVLNVKNKIEGIIKKLNIHNPNLCAMDDDDAA